MSGVPSMVKRILLLLGMGLFRSCTDLHLRPGRHFLDDQVGALRLSDFFCELGPFYKKSGGQTDGLSNLGRIFFGPCWPPDIV